MDGDRIRAEYLADVFAYCSRRLLRREDAEDATAETFQAALTHLHRLKTQDPRLWLFGIARRKVADALRRNRRRRETPLPDDLPAAQASGMEGDEAQGEIRRLVMGLPGDQREALLLQYLEELDHKQIAVVMGRSPAAVNSLLQRARARVLRDGRAYFAQPSEPREKNR